MERVSGLPIWNQFDLPCPATSAHKLSLSKNQTQFMKQFLSSLNDHSKLIQEAISHVKSEMTVLNRFVYKIQAVFTHDKWFKIFKTIQKTGNKFMDLNLYDTIKNLQEQHGSFSAEKFMYVAPKPKLEFVLVRIQGTVKLLAKLLCYCQYFGALILQRIDLGHFININVISMSLISRLWALSLHIIHLLFNTYKTISGVYFCSDLLPASSVDFLPKDYTFPPNLSLWLKEDRALLEMHHLLAKSKDNLKTGVKKEIWKSIKVVDDSDEEHLLAIKELVGAKSNESSQEMVDTLEEEEIVKPSFPSSLNSDLGEVVSRKPVKKEAGKKKKKTAKKRKLN